MPDPLNHDLKIDFPRDSLARQDFVISLRKYVLNDLASGLKQHFEEELAPAFARKTGRPFSNQDEIHAAFLDDPMFQLFSAARYNAQEMSWGSVISDVLQRLPQIEGKAAHLAQAPRGTLTLNPDLPVPDNVAGLDIHLMPGGYVSARPLLAGAIYDNGLTVFAAGMLAVDIDDIGQSMANYVKYRFPDLRPARIMDCGCTIGHNSLPWAQVFPEAEVHGIDVSGPAVRYAHARAESMGVPVHFHQMDATELAFDDATFDIVFSSQFLHELSLDDTARYMAEAYRVLRPGGLLITMELPPNALLEPYDQFYLDWDSYYNNEPYYRVFRDADVGPIAAAAGFDASSFFYFTVPQYFKTDLAAFIAEVYKPPLLDGDTGRLSDDIRYFGFGFSK